MCVRCCSAGETARWEILVGDRDEWVGRTGSARSGWSLYFLGVRVLGICQGGEKSVVERGTLLCIDGGEDLVVFDIGEFGD
jgi:hypothetical protein